MLPAALAEQVNITVARLRDGGLLGIREIGWLSGRLRLGRCSWRGGCRVGRVDHLAYVRAHLGIDDAAAAFERATSSPLSSKSSSW